MRRRSFHLTMVLVAACSLLSCSESGAGDRPSASDGADSTVDGTMSVNFTDGAGHTFSASEKAVIASVAEATYVEVQALIPDLTQDVVLEVSTGDRVIPETGEVGRTMTRQEIEWIVDPSRPGGVEAIATEHLRSTLFHELHHAVRGYAIRGPGSPDSFMDFVISEGLASVFERDAAGDRAVLWADYPDDVESWVQELMALPLDAPYGDWMFDHPDGRRWIGYRSGAYIVDLAVTASGRSAADLVDASTEDVLVLAGYDAS